MRKYEHGFGDLLLFLCPVLIALFLYSYREGAVCILFRIKPVMNKIYHEINYVSDEDIYGVYDVWQYPSDTILKGTGDCEDVSILLAAKIIEKTRLPVWIVTGDGKEVTHAWVSFKNLFFDQTRNKIVKTSVYERDFINIQHHTYSDALHRCAEDTVIY